MKTLIIVDRFGIGQKSDAKVVEACKKAQEAKSKVAVFAQKVTLNEDGETLRRAGVEFFLVENFAVRPEAKGYDEVVEIGKWAKGQGKAFKKEEKKKAKGQGKAGNKNKKDKNPADPNAEK